MPVRIRSEEGGNSDYRALRILTQSVSLEPLGGVELCAVQDCEALAARGHSVDLMYGADGAFRPRYEEAGITLEGPVSFGFEKDHPLKGFASFVRPAQMARSWKPDVLWLNRFEHIFWAESVALWSRSPIVCHLHHMPNFRRTALLSHGVSHFIAVSSFIRQAWIDEGIRPERISIVSNALPKNEYPRGGVVERAAARSELGIPSDIPVVLYYGRITKEKGFETLLDSWAGLESRGAEALLLLVGSPSPFEDPEFNRKLGALNSKNIRWFPMQSNVIPFLHAADIVAFPTWANEAFGRVIIEGMATGRPVVASRTGGVPEILSGPMERFTVEPRNADDLEARIASLLDWRTREPELESACVDWVETRFPFDEHVTGIEQVLLKFSRHRG